MANNFENFVVSLVGTKENEDCRSWIESTIMKSNLTEGYAALSTLGCFLRYKPNW